MAISYRRRSTAFPCKLDSRADACRVRCALVAVILGYLVFAALARAEDPVPRPARIGATTRPVCLQTGR